jgi:topoisomerase IV subunit B
LVERLMGKNPEHRFAFIQSRASAVEDDAIDA